jgi:ribonuclease P protein component
VPALRSRRDFDRIQSVGRSRSDRLMAIRFVPNGRDHDRVGISTGRRLGRAVVRNTVRRRIREIVRRSDELLRSPGPAAAGRDILIVARPASVDASFAELQAALRALLGEIPVSTPDRVS